MKALRIALLFLLSFCCQFPCLPRVVTADALVHRTATVLTLPRSPTIPEAMMATTNVVRVRRTRVGTTRTRKLAITIGIGSTALDNVIRL
jgi:hypothetical protein